MLALAAPGTAQAAPVQSAPLAPVTSQCDPTLVGCLSGNFGLFGANNAYAITPLALDTAIQDCPCE
ncbi:hypothetical protein C6A85_28190, partial [Mycobacterium sp. ITM-2017-0098]